MATVCLLDLVIEIRDLFLILTHPLSRDGVGVFGFTQGFHQVSCSIYELKGF